MLQLRLRQPQTVPARSRPIGHGNRRNIRLHSAHFRGHGHITPIKSQIRRYFKFNLLNPRLALHWPHQKWPYSRFPHAKHHILASRTPQSRTPHIHPHPHPGRSHQRQRRGTRPIHPPRQRPRRIVQQRKLHRQNPHRVRIHCVPTPIREHCLRHTQRHVPRKHRLQFPHAPIHQLPRAQNPRLVTLQRAQRIQPQTPTLTCHAPPRCSRYQHTHSQRKRRRRAIRRSETRICRVRQLYLIPPRQPRCINRQQRRRSHCCPLDTITRNPPEIW